MQNTLTMQNTTYHLLPFEVVVLISRVGRYSLVREVQEDAQDHFTIFRENIQCMFIQDSKTIYQLPNGLMYKADNKPAVIYKNNRLSKWKRYEVIAMVTNLQLLVTTHKYG
jgi:hypothetical protein